MKHVKCADFFLTGLAVVWPVLLWTGNVEAGVVASIALLCALLCSGMMVEGPEPF